MLQHAERSDLTASGDGSTPESQHLLFAEGLTTARILTPIKSAITVQPAKVLVSGVRAVLVKEWIGPPSPLATVCVYTGKPEDTLLMTKVTVSPTATPSQRKVVEHVFASTPLSLMDGIERINPPSTLTGDPIAASLDRPGVIRFVGSRVCSTAEGSIAVVEDVSKFDALPLHTMDILAPSGAAVDVDHFLSSGVPQLAATMDQLSLPVADSMWDCWYLSLLRDHSACREEGDGAQQLKAVALTAPDQVEAVAESGDGEASGNGGEQGGWQWDGEERIGTESALLTAFSQAYDSEGGIIAETCPVQECSSSGELPILRQKIQRAVTAFISEVQHCLLLLGFLPALPPQHEGMMDCNTRISLLSFQQSFRQRSGTVTSAASDVAIGSSLKPAVASFSLQRGSDCAAEQRNMSAAMGDVAQHIRVDVDALVRCGDLPPQLVSASSVFVMRRFGEAIRAAIKRFQQKRGMRADGRLDSVTQNSLLTVADTLETL